MQIIYTNIFHFLTTPTQKCASILGNYLDAHLTGEKILGYEKDNENGVFYKCASNNENLRKP
jgi:hypothetical protein